MSNVQQLSSENDRVVMTAVYPHLSAKRLFDCFTQPDLLAEWWVPNATVERRSGGTYHFAWNDMNWHLRGAYRDFAAGERLAFTWHWDHDGDKPERLVEIEFAPEGEGARLTLTHSAYEHGDEEERMSHLDGWLYFLPLINRVES